MDSKEIIENIGSIYERFGTPVHLQEHMLRAASVGRFICEHWKGEGICEDDVVAVLLLHDLGNVVRMTFDNPDLISVYEKNGDIDKLRRVMEETIEKYGDVDYEVTDKMCRELGVNDRILFLLNNKAFIQNKETCVSDDFDLKVCAYADQRIAPLGVIGLKERLDEARARGHKSLHHPEADVFVDCALKIERQVLDNTDLVAEDINDDSVKGCIEDINS
jgi:hypothetical protein